VNTNRILHSTFSVRQGRPVEHGTFALDGVSNPGSPIRLDFLDPAGSMTGKLLPTGTPIETVSLPSHGSIRVSCVDAANPFVFVSAEDLGLVGTESVSLLHELVGATLMEIRAIMSVRMGLAVTIDAAKLVMGTPKIAVVGPARDYMAASGRSVPAASADIWVRAYSMGKPHPSIQMTGAVCVGAAASVPGTLVQAIVATSVTSDAVNIGHAGGTMAVTGRSHMEGEEVVVECGSVYRTARRLMEGKVMYLAAE
jgi:2-methylaconitate cis-trans-isomerase PrpF